MKTKNILSNPSIVAVVLGLAIILPGCAAKKNTWGDPRTGIILEYRMPLDETLRYDLDTDYTMGMDVMGQAVEVKSTSQNSFTIQPLETVDGLHRLTVTVDSLFMRIESPRGPMEPNMSDVIGHPFTLVISSKGREVDYSEAEQLKYKLGAYEELNMAGDFQAVFPDLPAQAVKLGDSWNSLDTLVEKSASGYLRIIANIAHKLESYESYKGFDCIKVRSTFQGTLEGESQAQGVNMKTTGTIDGTDTWYFAYKEGLFLKNVSEGQAVSETKTDGDKPLVIPGTRDFVIVTELLSN